MVPEKLEIKLDNPVWHSLCETHARFCADYGDVKFYHPDYTPFGGFVKSLKIYKALEKYSNLIDQFYVVGEKPDISTGLSIKKELVCLQMIIGSPIELDNKEEIIELDESYTTQLFNLVNRVQPGYFRSKTHGLGRYFGIFKSNDLVAVSGERMKMEGLTELSAVVTHPNHTGKGYAKQLVAHTVNSIFNEGRKPFLHVAATNTNAVALYEKLGFTTRRKISFWNLGVVEN